MNRKRVDTTPNNDSNALAPPSNAKKPKDNVIIKDTHAILPCDKFCPKFGSVGIFTDVSTGAPYACVLNQTNIAQNNNKFFVIQVLKEFDTENYYTWIRWGRVGYHGQTAFTDCGNDVTKAISIFERKFSDKTHNLWNERHNFLKVSGKYDLVGTESGGENEEDDEVDFDIGDNMKEEEKMDSKTKNSKLLANGRKSSKSEGRNKNDSNQEEGNSKDSKINAVVAECKIERAIQDLIRLICDVKAMETAAADIEFDTNRTPLGKISTEQIKLGYTTLSQIAEILKVNGNVKVSSTRAVPLHNRRRQLTDLSSEFYTRIPHCTGMRAPPVIDNQDLLSIKVRMLEVLGDIKLGMDLLRESSKDDKENTEDIAIRMHPIDRLYRNLKCDISVLPHESEEFSLLEQYIMSTHAPTHKGYSMEVQEVI